MRIYDLEKSFDDFVKRDDVQIELIGENGGWIATVSTRKWSNEYQRYVCEDVGSCTAPSFLGAYDFIAQRIHHLTKLAANASGG